MGPGKEVVGRGYRESSPSLSESWPDAQAVATGIGRKILVSLRLLGIHNPTA